MTLRRTAIARKSELRRRTPMPRGRRELKTRAARVIARARDTGPSPATRHLVAERADWCCELCGRCLHDGFAWAHPHSFHHRQPRGMGGSTRSDLNGPANLLLVCGTGTTGCHGSIEKNRDIAYENGWLVRRPLNPAEVTVIVAGVDPIVPVLLTIEGTYQEAA